MRLVHRVRYLTIVFPGDHVNGPERGDNVSHHATFKHLLETLHQRKTRRTDPTPIRAPGTITDNVKAQLTVGPFDREIGLTRWWLDALNDQLKVIHQTLD